ncbi:MAG: hypothetical protein ACFFDN_37565 [Candidatus Hodarchaeota archaeon]
MREILPSEREKRLKDLINKKKELFDSEYNRIKSLARMVPILILGDYPKDSNERDVVQEVIKSLEKRFHFATPLKAISKNGNHLYCERKAIKHFPVVIKLENKPIGRPGAIGENVLISGDKESQEKTFLFIKGNPELLKKVFSIEHYFLYFPRTYFCKNDDDMVRKATEIAVREAYRLVYMKNHEN